MKLSNLLVNWKTTSAGLLAIVGGCTRLGFAIAQHAVTEEAITTSATTLLTGVGLLFARDVNVTSVDLGLQDVEKKSAATNVVTPSRD